MRLILNTIGLMVTTSLFNVAYSGTIEQQKIQELRAEVEALKKAMQQQNQVKVQMPISSEMTTNTLTSTKITPKADDTPLKWKSKNGAEVNIYGFVRADAAYQIEGAKGMFNSINSVVLEGDANKKATEDRLDSTLTTTRLGLDFKVPVENANVSGKVEMDFRGGSDKDTVRLRHVYMTYNNWLIGQTTSNFLSTETSPEMLDFNTALGGGTTRTPMVRYKDKFNSNTDYFVALEKGNDENRLPAATVKLSYKFAENSGLVTARALLQEVRVRELDDETKLGWGVGLGLNYKPLHNLILNANYSHVSGDNKFLLATSDNKRYIQNNSDIELIDFDAFTLGATYKFTPQVRSTLGYGSIIYDENNANGNDHLQQGWLNVMYNPFKPITVGMEYVYGERETIDNKIGYDNRLEIMAKYDF